MPGQVIDFRLFRYALVAAEHGSFRRAATTLNVQQSGVSRGVKNLEHRLGTELFVRGPAGVRPTPAGDRFLKEAALGYNTPALVRRAFDAGAHAVVVGTMITNPREITRHFVAEGVPSR